MKLYFALFFLILISCNKGYKSPNEYNMIKLYEYNGKPWDNDAAYNKLYNSYTSANALCYKIEKLNYSLKKVYKPNQNIDSFFFRKEYQKYRPKPECPIGFNRILLLSEDAKLRYVIKFNEYCKECFLINLETNDYNYIKIGYEDFIKLVEIDSI